MSVKTTFYNVLHQQEVFHINRPAQMTRMMHHVSQYF